MVGVGGLAMDYTRATQTKAKLFAAADAAALAAARTYGTANQREQVARRVFRSNTTGMTDVSGIVLSPQNIVKDGTNAGYRVGVTANIKTIFGGFVGASQIAVGLLAEANGSINNFTEVAMVLDTTGSMSGWKIDTLKQAGVKLIDELAPLAVQPDRLKVGIVPFGQYVNIGMGNRNRPWMNVPADYQDPPTTHACYQQPSVIGQTNCRQETVPADPGSPPTPPGTCYNDGAPYSCGGNNGRPPRAAYQHTVCDPIYGAPTTVCPPPTPGDWHRWHGCVGSRNAPLNVQDGNYGNRIPGLMDIHCGTEVLELTSSMPTAKSRINSLSPNGETYIPSGLIWGWRMLSPQAPFEARANTAAQATRKFLILMTDGLNTKSPTYPEHNGSDGATSNALVAQICANIAADTANRITIYSVAFDVNDTTTKNLLKKCATDTKGEFFDARNSTQFLAAFSKIGSTIAELRLTK